MIDLRAPFYGLAGAARLIRLDIRGAHMMIGGTRGFWASLIWSMVLVAPLYILLMGLRFDAEKYDSFRYFMVNAEVYVLAWLIFPLFMERISGFINRRENFLTFIIAYNWLSCLYNIIYLLVGLAQASTLLSWEAASATAVGVMFAGLVWIGYLTKNILNIPYSAAIGIVVLELFLGIMMSILSAGLLSQ